MYLVPKDKRRSYLVSEPNYHPIKWFSANLLAIEMNKAKVEMNNQSIQVCQYYKISKRVMDKIWHDYIKLKYGSKANLCYMDTDSFIVNIKTKDVHKDTTKDV